MRKCFYCFLGILLIAGSSVLWRSRPIMQKDEHYNSFFPVHRFLSKLNTTILPWMQSQIDSDFANIPPITENRLHKTYKILLERTRKKSWFYRYRILDNKLYKFIPHGAKCPSRDTWFEKALKTLLTHVKIADVDFIFCEMDGIPEDRTPPFFFLMEDPSDQAPIMAQAKLQEPNTKYVILVPDKFSLDRTWFDTIHEMEAINPTISWKEKESKAFWRGSFTDTWFPENYLLNETQTPRIAISYLSAQYPQFVDAGLITAYLPEIEQKWRQDQIFKDGASKKTHLLYKYLPVLDGHMCTYPGFQWRLLSNSVCLKQDSLQIQWFYRALTPYQHYIPIANDMSDLIEKVRWAQEHEEKVLQIIDQANVFAKENLMYEDVYRYLTLVLRHYATHQEIDFGILKKQMKSDPQWVCIQYRKQFKFFRLFHKRMQAWLKSANAFIDSINPSFDTNETPTRK